MPDVILQAGRERSLLRRHPWVLSGAVARVDGEAGPGDAVRVLSAAGEVLGTGHFSPHSNIRVRVLHWGKQEPAPDWLEQRIAAAVARRAANPLLAGVEALRLVNAEADGLPGLVADRYGDVVVVRLFSAGMTQRRDAVAAALRRATGAVRGFERADSSASRREGVPARQGSLWGGAPPDPLWFAEGDRRYAVKVADAQQTGFYLAQRDSRDLVQRLAGGRRVLDLFCYTGGFSVAAVRGGAASVTLVDSSADALALAQQNLAENGPDVSARCERADAFDFVRRDGGGYDLLIVDPPPLARARREIARATRAYKDVLLFTLRRAAPGAFVLAFCNSPHIDPALFRKIAFGAAHDAGREVAVLRELGPAPDFPVSLYHPEGASRTGLLLEA